MLLIVIVQLIGTVVANKSITIFVSFLIISFLSSYDNHLEHLGTGCMLNFAHLCVNTCCLSVSPVSVSDVEAIREGHQSEVLLSIADEFPADRCFTLVFRGRRGNLDLVAESVEEAQSWIRGMKKLIENLENMGEREKLDQYPSLGVFNQLH